MSESPPTIQVRTGESFSSFFRREFVAMTALAEAVSGDPAAAEDIASEAMTKTNKAWDKVSGYDKPGAFARRVTINLAHDHRRKRNRQRLFVRKHRPEDLTSPAPEVDHPVWAAVAQLPHRQRAAISLHYIDDMAVADIADVMEISVSTATSHLHHARTKLALLLEGGTR